MRTSYCTLLAVVLCKPEGATHLPHGRDSPRGSGWPIHQDRFEQHSLNGAEDGFTTTTLVTERSHLC